MRVTQKVKVLRIWVPRQLKEPQRWFYPYEFINEGSIFIGYKAPTRFCEMCLDYPDMIETKMDGKYRIGRLRLENVQTFLKTLPSELKQTVLESLRGSGVTITRKAFVPKQLPDGTTVMTQVDEPVTL